MPSAVTFPVTFIPITLESPDPRSVNSIPVLIVIPLSFSCQRGRLKLEQGFREWLEEAFDLAPLREAPLTHEVAMATYDVELAHRDPADRFILTT
jgi:PIN domain nuclease of toxin-antitoxin system